MKVCRRGKERYHQLGLLESSDRKYSQRGYRDPRDRIFVHSIEVAHIWGNVSEGGGQIYGRGKKFFLF